ncbi:hypothetical protein GCM10028805_23890 [Spirosoma harenae]
MDKIDKRKVGIGVAVVVGLVILFLAGKWMIEKKAAKKEAARLEEKKKQEEKITREAILRSALALRQLRRYADSVGIDTTRYRVGKSGDKAAIDAKLAQLLLEVRYGKKPSQLEFNGLKESVDTSWATKVGVEQLTKAEASLLSFAPYKQLVGHYNRLRKRATPLTSDSLRLIRQTLNFYRYINRFDAEQFVIVNIPLGELNVFDRAGKRMLPMQVIAGKPDRQTPCMTTYIQSIVAYPYWNVPNNIALEEIVPHIKRDVAYMYNQNYQVLDEKGHELNPEDIDWKGVSETNFPYRIRQASGCDNSLGLLKFELANPLAIYLHDTNGRDLFKLTTDRWRSHGCVRLQKPVELANLVLGSETFDADFMKKCLADQKPRTLPIAKPFPVFITYNIADVDAAGKLRFYKDIYGWDK